MKLIELLAKNLAAWPSDAAYLSQTYLGRVVRHSESGMPLDDVSINVSLADDWNGATVTKLQWLAERETPLAELVKGVDLPENTVMVTQDDDGSIAAWFDTAGVYRSRGRWLSSTGIHVAVSAPGTPLSSDTSRAYVLPQLPEVGVLIGYGDGPVTPLYIGDAVFVYRDESGDECYDSPYKRSDFYKYVDPWAACEAAIRAAVANGEDFKGAVDDYVNGI